MSHSLETLIAIRPVQLLDASGGLKYKGEPVNSA